MEPITILRSDELQVTIVYTPRDDGYVDVEAKTDSGYFECRRMEYEELHGELNRLISSRYRVIINTN